MAIRSVIRSKTGSQKRRVLKRAACLVLLAALFVVNCAADPLTATAQALSTESKSYGTVYAVTTVDGVLYRVYGSWQNGDPAYYAYDHAANALVLDENGQPVAVDPADDYASLTDAAIAADLERQIAALPAVEDAAQLDAGSAAFTAAYEQTQQVNAQLAYMKRVKGDDAYAAIAALVAHWEKLNALNDLFAQRTAGLNEWIEQLLADAETLPEASVLAAMSVADENGQGDLIYEAQKQSFFWVRDSLNQAPAMTAAEKQEFEANERVIALRQKLDMLFAVIEEKEIGYIASQIDRMLDYQHFGAIWEELTQDADFMDHLMETMNGGDGSGHPVSPEAAASWASLKTAYAIVQDCKARMAMLTEGMEDADAYWQQKLGAERWAKYFELNASLEAFNQIMTLDEVAGLKMTMVNTNAAYATAGQSYSLNADDATAKISTAALPLKNGITDYGYTTYTTNVITKFPAGAVGKKIVLTLAPGFKIHDQKDAGFTNPTLTDALNSWQGWVNPTKLWEGKTSKLNDGQFIYEVKDGTSDITLPLVTRVEITPWLEAIGSAEKPAVKVDMYYDMGAGQALQKSVQITTFTAKPPYPDFYPQKDLEKFAKLNEPEFIDYDGSYSNFQYRVNNSSSSVNRAVDSCEFYLEIDDGARFNGFKVSGSKWTTGTWTCDDMGFNNETGKRVYKFTLLQDTLGKQFVPEWIFPNEKFNLGDTVVANIQKVVLHYWGNKDSLTFVPTSVKAEDRTWKEPGVMYCYNMRFTETYKLENTSLVWVNSDNTITDDTVRRGDTSRYVSWRNDGFEDAISMIGQYSLGNRKASDSDPQVVTFHFDSTDIGVTALDIPMPGSSTLTEVKYKIVGSADWITQPVSLQPLDTSGAVVTDTSLMGKVNITNDGTLGLDINTHITDLQYVMPSVPGTSFISSEPELTAYGLYVYGHALTNANKTVTSTIEAHSQNDETNTTGLGNIYTVLQDTKQSYTLAGMNDQVRAPGSLFSFATRTNHADRNYPVVSPIFYIRDEFGLGIESLTLVNTEGVDLVAKYGIQAVLDHTEADGAKVYKVDTSMVAARPGADKYDALIGQYYSNGNIGITGDSHDLTIGYKVAVPSDYRESGKYGTYDTTVSGYLHKNPDRLYLTSAIPLASPSYYLRTTGTSPSDAFDADQNGDRTGTFTDASGGIHIIVSETNKNYYALSVIPQLNVQTQVKHSLAPDSSYLSWINGQDALQVNVSTGSTFNIRTQLQNDSATSVVAARVYQPIPKEGQYWKANGASKYDLSLGIMPNGNTQGAFPWSAELTGPATNPDPSLFDVYYGIGITPSANGDELTAEYTAGHFVPASSVSDWAKVNCVLFRVKDTCQIPGVAAGTVKTYDFTMNCKVSDTVLENGDLRPEIDQSIDVTTALCWENLSSGATTYSRYVVGDSAALQLSCGKIKGTVYMDFNGDGSLSTALGEGTAASDLLNGTTIELYLASNMRSPVQVKSIGADGSYEFDDLRRGGSDYRLVVKRPETLAGRYQFSVQNTAIDANGATHHMYGASADGKSAATIAVIAVKLPGQRDEGITIGGNGIYNILLTDDQMLRLSAEKKVSGDGASTERAFTFTIALTDKDDNPLTGTYPYQGLATVEGVEPIAMGQCTLADGKALFQLKHGQAVQLLQLPAGTKYTVTEEAISGYTATGENTANAVGMTANAAASIDNHRDAGDVTLAKTVAGNIGDHAEYFQFALLLTNANAEATYTVDLDKATSGELKYQGKTVSNPTAITVSKEADGSGAFQSGVKPTTTAAYFYLRSGESITIKGLPVDAVYRLQEVGANDVVAKEGYTVEYQVDNTGFVPGSLTPDTGKVKATGTTITFKNTRTVAVPTGIRMDGWPYLLLASAAFGGFMWLLCAQMKKKRCGQKTML